MVLPADGNIYVYLTNTFRLKMDSLLVGLRTHQCLTTRGWVYKDRNYSGKSLTISHPTAIENIHAAP